MPVKKTEKEDDNPAPAPPGPTSYDLKYDYVERQGPKGFSFGKPNDKKRVEKDDRVILYPNIDASRPNFRPTKSVMKPPQIKKVQEFSPERS